MNVTLTPAMERFVQQKLRSGQYDSVEHVLEAALAILEQHDQLVDFAPGELDALIAEGEADFVAGRVYDGEQVFEEIKRMSEERRRANAT